MSATCCFSESVDLARLRDRFRDWRVRLLLGEGGLVSDAAVEDLRALEARWRVAALAPPKARIRFVIGSRIVVHLGLFAGCTGKMLVDQGGTHVRVDIALPISSVTLPAAALIPMPIAA